MKRFSIKRFFSGLLIIGMLFSNMTLKVYANLDIIQGLNDIGYSESGTFYNSTLLGYGGVISRFSDSAGATATWNPYLKPGQYNVYVWNVQHSNADPNVRVDIVHTSGTTTVRYNQITTANGWYSVGTYTFNGGYSGFVKMTRSASYMRVSAVKFTPVGNDTGIPGADVNSVQPDQNIITLPVKSSGINRPSSNCMKLYVSTTGNDNNDGNSISTPLKTLSGARNKIRAIKASPGLPVGGITVYIRAGSYKLTNTFMLDGNDSGTTASPIEYRSYPGENVSINGAESIEPSAFQVVNQVSLLERLPNSARGKVMQVNLSALGITGLEAINFRSTNVPYAIYIDGIPASIARWPNVGYSQYGKIIDPGSRYDLPISRPFTFEYNGDRPSRWTQAVNPWMYGYWLTEYTADYVEANTLDTDKKWIKSGRPAYYGAYGGNRFFATNLFEEIDSPGEWYLGSDNQTLYLYPIEGMQKILLSKLNEELITIDGASNIVISGLTLEVTRTNGVIIKSGNHNIVLGCVIRDTGRAGMVISGSNSNSNNNALRDSDIYNTGEEGVVLSGGADTNSVSSLTHADNCVVNCNIHHTGVIGRSRKCGMTICGVGNRIAYNYIHDIPQQGIINGGDIMENVIEYNMIANTSLEIDDTAAMYFYSGWHSRGNIIRYNFIRDSIGIGGGVGAMGIYLDNRSSGYTITGNVILNAQSGVFISSGRDNIVTGNFMINCKNPVNIFMNTATASFQDPNGSLVVALKNVPYQNAVWSQHFPNLTNILNDQRELPKYNNVSDNLSFRTGAYSICTEAATYGTVANNIVSANDPGIDGTGWKLEPDAVGYTWQPAISSIPFNGIGIFTGGDRTNTSVSVPYVGGDGFYLDQPEYNAVNLDPGKIDLSWQNISGVKRYTVYIDTDPAFPSPTPIIVNQPNASISGLNYGTTYYWRVEANPYYNYIYPTHFNVGHGGKFSTIGLREALVLQTCVAQRMYDLAVEGNQPGYYASGSKAVLMISITDANTALDPNMTDTQRSSALSQLKNAIQTFIQACVKNKTLSTYSTYNMNDETIGNRPSGFFIRSYYPVYITVVADPNNPLENVALLNDSNDTSNQCTPRYFPYQSVRVAVSARVRAAQSNSAFDIKLLNAGCAAIEGTQGNYAAKVLFGTDGQIHPGYNKTGVMAYDANVWYSVKIDCDFTTRKYDVYVNNDKVAADVNMPFSGVTATDQVVFQTGDEETSGGFNSTTGQFYVDDVDVETPPIEGKGSAITSLKVNGAELLTFDMSNLLYHVGATISQVSYNTTPSANAAVVDLPGFTGAKAVVSISEDRASYSAYALLRDSP
jgi:hypothetical protein